MYLGKRGERVALVVIGMLILAGGIFLISLVNDGNGITGAAIGVLEPSLIESQQAQEENPVVNFELLYDTNLSEQPIIEPQLLLEDSNPISVQANCGGVTACSCGDTLTESWTMSSDLTGCNGSGLFIGASNIILDCNGSIISGNFTNTGVYSQNYFNTTITNCNIYNFSTGIYTSLGGNENITNNILVDINTGMNINANGEYIYNNTFTGNNVTTGLSIASDNNQIIANTITDYGTSNSGTIYGIRNTFGNNNNTYINNTLINIGQSGDYGFNILSHNHTLIGNNITNIGGQGIYISNSNYANLTNNYVYNSTLEGIKAVTAVTYLTLDSNQVIWNGNEGLDTNAANMLIINNTFQNNGANGIYIITGGSHNIINNTIINNSNYGLYLWTSNNNNIIGNFFANHTTAEVFLTATSNSNLFENNNFSINGNVNGFYSTSSHYNILSQNVFTGGTGSQVYLYDSSYNNLTANNLSLAITGFFIWHSQTNNFVNNTLSNFTLGIKLYGTSTGNSFNRNTILNNSYGVDIYSSNNSFNGDLFQDNTLSGIFFYGGNNTLVSNAIINGSYNHINSTNGTNNIFLNTFFNKSLVGIAGGEVTIKWVVTVKINNSEGQNIAGANITAYNNTDNIEVSGLTNYNGEVTLNLTEFVQSITGQTYHTPHSINATLSLISGVTILNSTTINLSQTESNNINFGTNVTIPTCGYVNINTSLLSNLVSNGTCLIINQSNITINGNGVTILGNGTGIGIDIANFSGIIVYNLIIANFSQGVHLLNSSNGFYYTLTLENNTVGLILENNSNGNNISTNYLRYNTNGSMLINSTENFIYNNYYTNTNNTYDPGNNYYNTSQSCSIGSGQNILGFDCIGGNYWSDYSGTDNDGDSIGDQNYNISGGSNVDYLPLVSVSSVSCGTINQSIVLSVNDTITALSGADCFTITGNNTVIEGNGATLVTTGSGIGIYAVAVNNLTINNLKITSEGRCVHLQGDGFGNFYGNHHLTNNTFNCGDGMYLRSIVNSTFTNNVINGTDNSSNDYAMYTLNIINNSFTDNNIISNAVGIFLESSSHNNTFYNGLINGTLWDIYSSLGTGKNYFVNVTINQSKNYAGANQYHYYKWYALVNLTNTSNIAIANGTVYGYDVEGTLEGTILTNSQGIGLLPLTEKYIENNITYYLTNNHTIYVEKAGFTKNQTSFSMVNATTMGVPINLTLTDLSCGMNLSTDVILGSNLTGSGNCFGTEDDSIVINGNNYAILGNGSGDGISFNGRSGITIANLTISNFSSGINLVQTNNSELQDLTFSNNEYGIVFNNSDNNQVSDSTFTNSSTYHVLATNTGGTRNYLYNVSITPENVSISGTASVYVGWYVDVNVTYNNQSLPLGNANVTGYFNSSGEVDQSLLTSSNGIAHLGLSEWVKNSSGTTYLTPHNISVSYDVTTEVLTNSSIINLSQTNNTNLNLSLTINCIVPYDGLVLTSSTTLCPGTFYINDLAAPAYGLITTSSENIVLSCLNTVIEGNGGGQGLYFSPGATNITITKCSFNNYDYGARIRESVGITIINSTFSSNNRGINIDHSDNCTISGSSIINNDNFAIWAYISNNLQVINSNLSAVESSGKGVYLSFSDYANFSKNKFSDSAYGVYLISSDNNNFTNNTFSSNSDGAYIRSGDGNLFYYNTFTSSTLRHIFDTGTNNLFNTSVNVSGNFSAQGNSWDDFCDKGTDNNSDTYADGPTTNTSNDWPYNSTTSSKFTGSGADYGPKIQDCVTVVQLGGSSGGGGGSTTTVAGGETTTPTVTPTPTKTTTKTTTEIYNAEETKKHLKTETKTQTTEGKTVLSFTLENTGTKAIRLFPMISQDVEDPFFIVNTKTLGGEDSAFYNIAAISYSGNSIAGKLLEATLVDPEEVIIPPGETVIRDVEINEGLSIPRQIKVQFTSFGENVYEEEITIQRTAVSGSAVDLDTQNDLMDVYVVLASEKVFTENGNSENHVASNNALTGAAAADIFSPNLNRYTVEMNINSKDGKTNYFSDFYGPYNVKSEQALVFAQQYKYNPAVYNDEYQVQTKIYKAGKLVTENSFDVEMNGGKEASFNDKFPKYLSWVVLVIFMIISFVFVLLIITKTSGEKKSLKKEEL